VATIRHSVNKLGGACSCSSQCRSNVDEDVTEFESSPLAWPDLTLLPLVAWCRRVFGLDMDCLGFSCILSARKDEECLVESHRRNKDRPR
jgi:hypothetical protein